MKKPFYKRELSHSYLVIDGIMEEELGRYQCQMILRNRIPGLLPCSERFLEGRVCLYYDISSRQSLGRLYEATKIGYAGIRGIVDNLAQVQDTIAEYLLEENGLVLEPEYIYMDLETEQLLFLYDPFGNVQAEWGSIYLPMAEFLLEHIDHREEQAVETAYQFYKMSKVESFTIESFRTILEKGRRETEETVYAAAKEWSENYFREEEGLYEYLTMQDETGEKQDREPKIQEHSSRCKEGGSAAPEDFDKDGKQRRRKKGADVRYPAGLAVSFFVFLLLCTAIWYLQPAGSERICLFGCLAADGLLVLWFLWKTVYIKGQDREAGKEKEGEGQKEDIRNRPLYADEEDGDGPNGPTVFLGAAGRDGQGGPRLVDMQEENREYSLDRLPVMVGKMRSRVQLLLPDASVSRIHARFVEKDGRTALIDLNSTNGTFVNGIRLEQEETAILEDGDAVAFGNMELTYRE